MEKKRKTKIIKISQAKAESQNDHKAMVDALLNTLSDIDQELEQLLNKQIDKITTR